MPPETVTLVKELGSYGVIILLVYILVKWLLVHVERLVQANQKLVDANERIATGFKQTLDEALTEQSKACRDQAMIIERLIAKLDRG